MEFSTTPKIQTYSDANEGDLLQWSDGTGTLIYGVKGKSGYTRLNEDGGPLTKKVPDASVPVFNLSTERKLSLVFDPVSSASYSGKEVLGTLILDGQGRAFVLSALSDELRQGPGSTVYALNLANGKLEDAPTGNRVMAVTKWSITAEGADGKPETLFTFPQPSVP